MNKVYEGMVNHRDSIIAEQQKKIDALEKKLAEAVEALRFYSIYSPRQFPEGYYEICIEEGIGGHNRFGTIASKTLKSLEEKESER